MNPRHRWSRYSYAVLLIALLPLAVDAELLQPMLPGWERIFRIDVKPGERKGKPVLRGDLVNDSPYTIARVRLLTDALDGSGNVIAQKIEYVPRVMGPFSSQYFEIPAPGPASAYRVQVFDYERIESGPGRDWR